jgi:hypothetical protein
VSLPKGYVAQKFFGLIWATPPRRHGAEQGFPLTGPIRDNLVALWCAPSWLDPVFDHLSNFSGKGRAS